MVPARSKKQLCLLEPLKQEFQILDLSLLEPSKRTPFVRNNIQKIKNKATMVMLQSK